MPIAIKESIEPAIFSIFNGLFLRPLPFAQPNRLVDIDETAPKWNLKYVSISNPDAYAWMKGNSTFDGMAFFNTGGANLSSSTGAAQRIRTAAVTWRLLAVLGLKPVAGRSFLSDEDRPGGAKVVMLSYALWQRLFGGDRGAIGQILKLDEQPYTVVGILPREAVLPPDEAAAALAYWDITEQGNFEGRNIPNVPDDEDVIARRLNISATRNCSGSPESGD